MILFIVLEFGTSGFSQKDWIVTNTEFQFLIMSEIVPV